MKKSEGCGLRWKIFLGLWLCTWIVGCSSGQPPGFERVKADLEKRLADDRGNTAKGNADIYKIVSLAMISSTPHGEDRYAIQFKGEVECVKGFYMSAEGQYSVHKPTWAAKRHVTEGTRIDFSGEIEYRKTGVEWAVETYSTKMGLRYAPPV